MGGFADLSGIGNAINSGMTRNVGGVIYKRDASGYWRDPFGQIGNITPGKNPITGFPDPANPVFTPLDKWLQPDPNGSGSGRLASDDPRYWDLQYAQLDLDQRKLVDESARGYAAQGLDAETSRRNALAGLITNRNQTAANLYQTDVDAAKAGAQFATNPRDAMTDLYYRNAVGGSTPNGDSTGAAGDARQTGLFNRFNEIFGNVAGSRAKAWDFASAIPPSEYLNPAPVGPSASAINPNTAGAPSPGPDPWAGMAGHTPAELASYFKAPGAAMGGTFNFVGPGHAAHGMPMLRAPGQIDMVSPMRGETLRAGLQGRSWLRLPGAAQGGEFNFDPGVGPEEPGHTPTSTEGGLNINISEPAVIVGIDSGKVYAKIAEPRPDGTRRSEQLIVKPLKSETEKDKQYAEMGKAPVAAGLPSVPGMAEGGSVTSIPKPWDFLNELKKNLQGVGGSGGGAGGSVDPHTGVAPLRLYAGAPDALMSPTQRQYLYAAQSAAGVSPEEVDWTLKQFTPNAPINNLPRVSY